VTNDYLLAALTLLSWLRALSFLRLFQKTRALIRLIIEVIKDMEAFAIVLFISLFGLTLTFYSLTGSSDFVGNSKHTYLLMLGDFSYDEYNAA